MPADIVIIHRHELDAMRQLVLQTRAIATTLINDRTHTQKLLNWAQMVEDVLSRAERNGKA